jgi:hypothetical protein
MAEGAVVSHGPVPMRPQLVQCCSAPSGEGGWKSMTSGGSTSRKSSAVGVIPGDDTEARRRNTYKQGEGSRGEER